MADDNTKRLVELMAEMLEEQRLTRKEMGLFREEVNQRFAQIDKRFERIETYIERLAISFNEFVEIHRAGYQAHEERLRRLEDAVFRRGA